MIDNGQLVAFDLFEPPAVSPAADGTSRSAPPEWPLRSAAAAAAALPHQWHDEDVDDRGVADEVAEPVAAGSAISETTDTTGADTTVDSSGEDDLRLHRRTRATEPPCAGR